MYQIAKPKYNTNMKLNFTMNNSAFIKSHRSVGTYDGYVILHLCDNGLALRVKITKPSMQHSAPSSSWISHKKEQPNNNFF